jgi:hypothetical protein
MSKAKKYRTVETLDGKKWLLDAEPRPIKVKTWHGENYKDREEWEVW